MTYEMIKTDRTKRIVRGMRAGFTTLELIFATALLMGLMAILIPMITSRMEQGRRNSAKIEMQQMKVSVEQYYDDMGSYPSSLEALIKRPSGAKADSWNGPYLDKKKGVPKDPWSKAYQYRLNPDGGSFELYS